MEKFSVRKPFTVLVCVIAVVVLGFVSVTHMSTDLLPEMNLPYLIVITTYPGASPEKVESEVSEPMEKALGTVSNVENVLSVSAENYSMVQLEFEDGTNMDSATVKVSSAVDDAAASLPDACGNPSIMEISMDMIATMYLAVSRSGDSIDELSEYISDEVQPYIERQEGVARVSGVGLVEKVVQVDLNQEKIDRLNARVLNEAEEQLDDAKEQLDNAKEQADEGQEQLEEQQSTFGEQVASGLFGAAGDQLTEAISSMQDRIYSMASYLEILQGGLQNLIAGGTADSSVYDPSTISGQIGNIVTELYNTAAALNENRSISGLMQAVTDLSEIIPEIRSVFNQISTIDYTGSLSDSLQSAQDGLGSISDAIDNIPALVSTMEDAIAAVVQGGLDASVGFSTAANQLSQAQQQIEAASEQYESQRDQVLKNANLDQLVNAQTLSQMIYAQNFSMPAGYIDDKNDESWLLKVGDEYDTSEGIADALLADIDGVGTIRLADVADITVIDNSDETYAKLNGEDAVVLSVYKGSAAGTNQVSRNVNQAIQELEDSDDALSFVSLMDQGSYITLIVRDILMSMVSGALLAIVVLALFLRDVKPTILVGISIPLSVLTTLVLMYFSGLSLNIMTLSGLSLGIGMLVDNSIVVMENIFRLRGRGMPAPRAAVQGTRQVLSAIISSTLTTVCVFLPLVFTTGTVRELMVPMGLSIAYCLVASLLVAVTVIPASASTILRRSVPKKDRLSEKVKEKYGTALSWCLDHKPVVLFAAIALLAVSVAALVSMGIVILPEMTGDNIEATITTPEEDTRETSYQKADDAMEAMMSIDGVKEVGIMDMGSTTGLVSSLGGSSDSYGSYTCYITVNDGVGSDEIEDICDEINALSDENGYTISASAGGMSDMTSLMSSGLSVNVYGPDLDQLEKTSKDVADIIEDMDGFENVSDGSQENEQTIHLIIDKDQAMSYGLTVAQIYAQISSRLTTDVTSTTITNNGETLDVVIHDDTDPLTRENLLDMEFSATDMSAAMSGSASGTDTSGLSGMTGSADMSGTGTGMSEAGTDASGTGTDTSENGTEAETSGTDDDTDTHKLGEFATIEETTAPGSVTRENLTRYMTVSADTMDGYNTTLLSRSLQKQLDELELPDGYSVEIEGETSQVNDMVGQMVEMAGLALLFIYLVMVAQFQSLLSPFIVMFTIPLAFTGGMLGLLISRQQLSMLSLMGFLVLIGTVVNNGIVFVDYTNQLRTGGLERRDALIATGQTRMRPILMTALTTILAMAQLIFGNGLGSQMGRGMATVIAGGLLYATLMTLFVVPIMYDIFFKRMPLNVDIGDDLDDAPDDAAEYLEEKRRRESVEAKAEDEPESKTEAKPEDEPESENNSVKKS